MSTEGHERIEAPDDRPELGAVSDKDTGMMTFSEIHGESTSAWFSIEERYVVTAPDFEVSDE